MARKTKDETTPVVTKSKKELLQEKVDNAKIELDNASVSYDEKKKEIDDKKKEIEKIQAEIDQLMVDFKPVEKAYLKVKNNYEKHTAKLNEYRTRELVEEMAKSGKSIDDLLLMLKQ